MDSICSFAKLLIFLTVGALILFDLPFASASSAHLQGTEASFVGLDKITGRITGFKIKIGETYSFGSLRITPRVCYTGDIGESELTDSFLDVDEIMPNNQIKHLFSGWMFANSPGLNALDHSIYDFWLASCRL
ncbi:DUF2155 domain-containing protein [Bartonella sp. TP]|uniref:DUF2155 domain-containing protein n=1 Tax=Bartonella sp. TP TaxID=3057550 RepID=UPI0025B0909C|nr:DUF2155 domain-containing protein [Bartonella sp. TP]WJW79855.1 DUF2155 domain-containing protein [Bartonella sp. TP]